MSLSITGAAAAFVTLVQTSSTTYEARLTQAASAITPGSYTATVTESQSGYSNSPQSVTYTFVVQGSSTTPIARTITPVADRTFFLKRVPSQSQTALGSYFAAFASQPFDPSDKSPWYVDLNGMLADGETLSSIVSLSPSSAAAALNMSIDDGARRCAYDVANGLIEFRLKCSASSTTPFSGNCTQVGIDLSFSVNSADNLIDQYHKTLGINARIA